MSTLRRFFEVFGGGVGFLTALACMYFLSYDYSDILSAIYSESIYKKFNQIYAAPLAFSLLLLGTILGVVIVFAQFIRIAKAILRRNMTIARGYNWVLERSIYFVILMVVVVFFSLADNFIDYVHNKIESIYTTGIYEQSVESAPNLNADVTNGETDQTGEIQPKKADPWRMRFDRSVAEFDGSLDYKLLTDIAETATFILALITSILTLFYLLGSMLSMRRQRRSTARNWVLYNTVNRMSQDLTAMHYLRCYVMTDAFREIYFALSGETPTFSDVFTPDLEPRRVQINSPDENLFDRLSPEQLTKYHEIRNNAKFVLTGFKNTWANDDILSSAMAFDFSLLHETEKSQTLSYFENYNALQDNVSMALPFLDRSDEDNSVAEMFLMLDYIYTSIAQRIGEGNLVVKASRRFERLPNFKREVMRIRLRAQTQLEFNIGRMAAFVAEQSRRRIKSV